jgi:hypothetical protein
LLSAGEMPVPSGIAVVVADLLAQHVDVRDLVGGPRGDGLDRRLRGGRVGDAAGHGDQRHRGYRNDARATARTAQGT